MFAAVLGGTTLAAAVPAASAAPAAHEAPAASQGKVVDKSCQNRTGGVSTCEWLYEWRYKLINNKYTINVEAYGSMNGKVNKDIKNIYTYGKQAFFAPKHAIAVLAGPGGTGYIAGHDGKRLCSGDARPAAGVHLQVLGAEANQQVDQRYRRGELAEQSLALQLALTSQHVDESAWPGLVLGARCQPPAMPARRAADGAHAAGQTYRLPRAVPPASS